MPYITKKMVSVSKISSKKERDEEEEEEKEPAEEKKSKAAEPKESAIEEKSKEPASKSSPEKSKAEGSAFDEEEEKKSGSAVKSKSKAPSKAAGSKEASKAAKSGEAVSKAGSKASGSKVASKVAGSKEASKSAPASKEGSKAEQSKEGSKAEQSKAVSGEEASEDGSGKPSRQQRITPSYVDSDPKAVSKFVPQAGTEGFTLDDKRLAYMKMLLKINVEKILKEDGAQPAEPDKPPFNKYTIEQNADKSLDGKMGSRCRVVKATHADYPEAGMVAKIFDSAELLSEDARIPNRLYLKMLRQVGKKHPYVLSTWDIFDKGGTIIIIQEFANRYDVGSFLSKYGQQEEQIICQWARQLYKAMDFLGDMGICHRG